MSLGVSNCGVFVSGFRCVVSVGVGVDDCGMSGCR